MLNPGAAGSNITGSVAVYFDPATPSVAATFSGTVGVNLGKQDGTLRISDVPGTVAVYFSPANPAVAATFSGSIAAVPTSGSGSNLYDETADAVRVLISGSHSAASLQIKGITETIGVHLQSTAGTIRIGDIPGTVAVYFSPSNPAVAATFSGSIAAVPTSGSGSTLYDETADAVRVLISGSHSAASLQIKGITESINVHVGSTGGTLRVGDIPGTVAVYFSPSNPAVAATFSGSIAAVPTTGSGDPIYEETGNWTRVLIAGSQSAASLTINGTLTGITNSIAVHMLSTNGTMAVNVGKTDGTVTVRLDPGYTLGKVDQGIKGASSWLVDSQHTASIFTVTGTYAGSSDLGSTLVSPSASYNFKVFAYSLHTTGIVSTVARFTNGAGSATELWRGLSTANQTSSTPVGANLAVSPPSYIFATGVNTTLALHTGNATLVHFSVSYFKESA